MSTASPDPFIHWFRASSPYIHAHRGKTFVIVIGGESVADKGLPHLIHDLALLHGLGIRLVLVFGARPQIEERLRMRGATMRYADGMRVTDPTALSCVKDAAGSVRVELEALLSMGLANSPMAGVRLRVISGNFVTARPIGVVNGVDFAHTGKVRRVDARGIAKVLDAGAIALIPPIGYSPTGEAFNLSSTDTGAATAMAMNADKLIYLVDTKERGSMASRNNMLPSEVEPLLPEIQDPHLGACLRNAAQACRNGVRRVHLVDRKGDGVLLSELFTRDGSGLLVASRPFEDHRDARLEDVGGILELLEPLEQEGVLVRRSRELLETEIDHFCVVERDGMIIGCAALYPWPEEQMAELACLAVHPDYRDHGRGNALLASLEERASAAGIGRIFVLSTQTAHWFLENGFVEGAVENLPVERQRLYNLQRNSKVFCKEILDRAPGPVPE